MKFYKTRQEIENAIIRVNNRKNEILIQIRELKKENETLEQMRGVLEDIRDEYESEFESNESEDK